MTEVTDRPKSNTELAKLLDEANQSPFIGYISLDELQTLIDVQTIRFVYEDDVLAGFGGWITINSNWVEIGPFFVSERFQGQGLGKFVINLVVDECNQRGNNQVAVTRNPAVKYLLAKVGYVEVSFLQMPLSLQWYVISKLSPSKLLRFLQKPVKEPIAHLIHMNASS